MLCACDIVMQDKGAQQITLVLNFNLSDVPKEKRAAFRDEIRTDVARAAGNGLFLPSTAPPNLSTVVRNATPILLRRRCRP